MAKKPLTAALIGILILLIATALAWSAGLLYWHLRITTMLRSVREEVRTIPEERWHQDPDFSDAGSRSFPYLLAELRRAILEQDRLLAYRICQELRRNSRDIQPEPESPYHVPTAGWITAEGVSWQAFRLSLKECEEWWARKCVLYPPWWAWWKGARNSD